MRWTNICLLGGIVVTVSPHLAKADTVFPADLCEHLSPPSRSAIEPYLKIVPQIPADKVRDVPAATAESLVRQAAAKGWTTIDFFTDEAFRSNGCMFYFSKESLIRIHQTFKLHLTTTIQGADQNGRPFQMTAYFGGLSMHYIFYDRDQDIIYPRGENIFKLHPVIQEQIAGPGALNIGGLSVYISQLKTWWDIRGSKKKSPTQLDVYIGPVPIVKTMPLYPIEPILAKKNDLYPPALNTIRPSANISFDSSSQNFKPASLVRQFFESNFYWPVHPQSLP